MLLTRTCTETLQYDWDVQRCVLLLFLQPCWKKGCFFVPFDLGTCCTMAGGSALMFSALQQKVRFGVLTGTQQESHMHLLC